jgi:anthranilate synthase component 1
MTRAGRPAPLVRMRLVNDLETPVSAFIKLSGGAANAFLLESVEGGEKLGRYSIIGLHPDRIWRLSGGRAAIAETGAGGFVDDSLPPVESLKAFLDASAVDPSPDDPPMAAGVFGYLGYDAARLFERLPPARPSAVGAPEAIFLRPGVIAVFDSLRHEIFLAAPARARPGESEADARARAEALVAQTAEALRRPHAEAPARIAETAARLAPCSNTPEADYLDMVRAAKEHIAAGDIFQAVLSQRFEAPFDAPPFELYRSLRRLNPSPFMFFFDFGGFSVVGSSPEILVRVRAGEVTIRPIAGTRRRGATAEEDTALAAELLADEKERAEHLMLLDLGRNDVGRASEIGTVRVTESFAIERYSHVMHIVSNVVGRLKAGMHPVDAVAAGFPAGTVTGAPKIRAMEIIDALEREGRGVYGGAIGYFSADGNVDTCIALRTAVVKDGIMHVQAGGGIVADSDPAAEAAECRNKAAALFAAADAARALYSR